MNILFIILQVIAIIIGVSSSLCSLTFIAAAFAQKDKTLTFLVIYSLLGSFILGMCAVSILG